MSQIKMLREFDHRWIACSYMMLAVFAAVILRHHSLPTMRLGVPVLMFACALYFVRHMSAGRLWLCDNRLWWNTSYMGRRSVGSASVDHIRYIRIIRQRIGLSEAGVRLRAEIEDYDGRTTALPSEFLTGTRRTSSLDDVVAALRRRNPRIVQQVVERRAVLLGGLQGEEQSSKAMSRTASVRTSVSTDESA